MEYQNGEEMDTIVLLKQVDVRVAKNGKQFLAIVFEDSSGEISGKYWNASNEDVNLYQAGEIVEVNGRRETYQNNPQIRIYSLRPVMKEEGYEVSQFVKQAPVSSDSLLDKMSYYQNEITHPVWHAIVNYLVDKYHKEFFDYPAAKTNHHAFAGGLAFHTVSMLDLAHNVLSIYEGINKELLYSGIILHDLAKTIELSGPVSTDYTLEGNLIGHIALIDEEVVKAAQTLEINEEAESFLLLRHLVLSHHGLKEYGSPVRPQIIEAEVLHRIDEFDASMNMMTESLKQISPGEFTGRIFALENRKLYKPYYRK